MKADRWIIIKGYPIFSCRTRKQVRRARKQLEKEKGKYEYRYIGKVFDKQRKIILDL